MNDDDKPDAEVRYDEHGRRLIRVQWEINGPFVWIPADGDMGMW